MAKQTSLIKLRGTFKDVTFVASRAYGDHTRAKRGTYKPAPLNESLKREGKMVLMANVPAKIIKDAICAYRGDILGGTTWQRLVSFFRKQYKSDGKFDFTRLAPFDIHERTPLYRLLEIQSVVKPDKKKSQLKVELHYATHPKFKKIRDVDSYQLTVIAVFPDVKKKSAVTTHASSVIHGLEGEAKPLCMELAIPPRAKAYCICLKLEACHKGMPMKARTATALCFIDGGAIG